MVYRVLGRLLDDGKGECMKVGQLGSTVKVRLEHEVYLSLSAALPRHRVRTNKVRAQSRVPYHGRPMIKLRLLST